MRIYNKNLKYEKKLPLFTGDHSMDLNDFEFLGCDNNSTLSYDKSCIMFQDSTHLYFESYASIDKFASEQIIEKEGLIRGLSLFKYKRKKSNKLKLLPESNFQFNEITTMDRCILLKNDNHLRYLWQVSVKESYTHTESNDFYIEENGLFISLYKGDEDSQVEYMNHFFGYNNKIYVTFYESKEDDNENTEHLTICEYNSITTKSKVLHKNKALDSKDNAYYYNYLKKLYNINFDLPPIEYILIDKMHKIIKEQEPFIKKDSDSRIETLSLFFLQKEVNEKIAPDRCIMELPNRKIFGTKFFYLL